MSVSRWSGPFCPHCILSSDWSTYNLLTSFHIFQSFSQESCWEDVYYLALTKIRNGVSQLEKMYQTGKILVVFLLRALQNVKSQNCTGEILAKDICIPGEHINDIQNCPNEPPNNIIMAKMGNVQVIDVQDR